jgi:hypothetical protein
MRRANLLAYFLVLGLAACGGSGGGGSSSTPSAGGGGGTGSAGGGTAGGGGGGDTTGTGTGGSTSTRTPIPEQVALSFTGATTLATVSPTTTSRLMADTLTGSRLAQMISSEEIALIGQTGAISGPGATQTIACGTGSINISDNGDGTLKVDYVDCKKGGDTLNGPAILAITNYDSANKIIRDATLTFVRAHFTGFGIDADISGTQRTVVTPTAASWCHSTGCATETMTQNLVVLTREAGNITRMMRSRLVVTNEYESVLAPTFFTQRLGGDVADDQLGLVNVSTATAQYTGPWGDLYYSTRFQSFPDWGIVQVDGAANSQATSSSMGIGLTKILVDADGDGIFENNARMSTFALASPIGANLNDSDGDGMHDSYETANALFVSQDDRNGDFDVDGWTNYQEYLVAAAAGTNGSVPSDVRHLWVTGLRDIGVDAAAPNNIDVFFGSSGSGTVLDTETRELSATGFTGLTEPNNQGNLTVTDAQGRTFTLTPTASDTVWTLTSSTGTSITIDNVGGINAGSLIRYGDRGIAFRTTGSAPSGSNAAGGYVYLIESRTLIP